MPTDYLLFVHGVNVREANPDHPQYSNQLFQLIEQTVSPTLQVKNVPLYWGNVNQGSLKELTQMFQDSSVWPQMWFPEFRKSQLLQFAGDAALYISRLIGGEAVTQLKQQALNGLKDYEYGRDRLHIVTHSWGTVILFDVLFSNRWLLLPEQDPGRQSVEAIRRAIFGIAPRAEEGFRLASMHTMGSPIALFSLITLAGRDAEGRSTHDLTPGLVELLKNLYREGQPLPWRNFIHPGDPVAWPLEQVVRQVVDLERRLDIKDIITKGSGLLERVVQPFRDSFVALLNGGQAHESYWQNKQVGTVISKILLDVAEAQASLI